MNKHTLIIDQKTIKKLVSIKDAVKAVEKGFKDYGRGKVQMPPKVYLYFKKHNGDLRAMPVYDEAVDRAGIKWVNVHPGNRRKGLPTVMGLMILSDPRSGFPLAVMDATLATALRTGAAGGVAAEYMSAKASETVALVGCGRQACSQLEALAAVRVIKEARVWGKTGKEAENFCSSVKVRGVDLLPAGTPRECVKGADIIVTTTPARKPIVKLSWLKEGAHINAIGADAPGKQELEPSILKHSRLVVDSWEQASHSGEINVPLRRKSITRRNVYADIGEIVSGKKKGRLKETEITVFDSTGLAVQDIVVADLIYRKALKRGAGKKIRFM
ncbi:MAG: alanine dehydrogenase [Candidatus Omnitrophica bacterium]|nr:alanine dehydrogenase [Candidatus Omnitrophota bacterium]